MAEKILFQNATIIDGTGNDPIKGSLLIDGSDILEVGNVTCEDARSIDLSGKTIMPGIINAHAHITFEANADPVSQIMRESDASIALRAQRNLMRQLRSGVTFLRDMGAPKYIDIDVRNARNQGLIYGPEFICAGRPITMTGGHIWVLGRECDGLDEVRKGVREQLRAGADLIKIIATGGVLTPGVEPGAPQLNYDEICVAVEEANKAGKKTATHAQGSTGIMNAVRAGINSVEHGFFLTDEIIELMIEKGTYLVPTFFAVHAIYDGGVASGIPAQAVAKVEKAMHPHAESFKKAYKAGVKMAMGPDSGTPLCLHTAPTYELTLMVQNGMSTKDAIVAATKNGADLLGILDRYGTLEQGKAADFLVLDADPLADISALQTNLESVYKLGKLVN